MHMVFIVDFRSFKKFETGFDSKALMDILEDVLTFSGAEKKGFSFFKNKE